jgi:hypothetical protein
MPVFLEHAMLVSVLTDSSDFFFLFSYYEHHDDLYTAHQNFISVVKKRTHTKSEQTRQIMLQNASLKIDITNVNHADHLHTIVRLDQIPFFFFSSSPLFKLLTSQTQQPKEELYAGLSAADQRTLALLGGAKDIDMSSP